MSLLLLFNHRFYPRHHAGTIRDLAEKRKAEIKHRKPCIPKKVKVPEQVPPLVAAQVARVIEPTLEMNSAQEAHLQRLLDSLKEKQRLIDQILIARSDELRRALINALIIQSEQEEELIMVIANLD